MTSTQASSTLLPIVISGTGPAALLLGHALRRSSLRHPIRIFERDVALSQRSQGYRFNITNEGVQACRSALSPQHFDMLRKTAGANRTKPILCLDALTGQGMSLPMFDKPDRAVEEPLMVDRAVLRRVLFQDLEDITTFGKAVTGYTASEFDSERPDANAQATIESNDTADRKGLQVHLSDGTSMQAALLIGADGAGSAIRAQLSPTSTMLDTEMRMIYGKTPLTHEFRQAMAGLDKWSVNDDLVGTFALINDPTPRPQPLFMMYDTMQFRHRADPDAQHYRLPKDYLYWAMAVRADAIEVVRMEDEQPWRRMTAENAADFTRDMTKAWHPSLRSMHEHQDVTETRALESGVMALPVVDWRSEGIGPMVTLIGDAAHAMPPTGGIGATLACRDAVELVRVLEQQGVCQNALRDYESAMRKYATPEVAGSVAKGKKLVGMREISELKPVAWA